MKILKVLVIVVFIASLTSCNNGKKKISSLESEIDSVSYALGLSYGSGISKQFKSGFEEVNVDAFKEGFTSGIDSLDFLIEEKDIQKILEPFFNKKREEQMKAQQEKAIKEAEAKFGHVKKAGEEFLTKNKTKKGVITTESGLQYVVIKEGKGDKVKPTDKVKLHYHGTTIEDKVFDSSVDKKSPIESSASGFVPGFSEALTLMKKGSKYKVFIPQELAYGFQQRGELILPFSTLIFEIEILDIIK
jgi:FKBP-type peptidyl-prolyl cis-trans isomerase FklB